MLSRFSDFFFPYRMNVFSGNKIFFLGVRKKEEIIFLIRENSFFSHFSEFLFYFSE